LRGQKRDKGGKGKKKKKKKNRHLPLRLGEGGLSSLPSKCVTLKEGSKAIGARNTSRKVVEKEKGREKKKGKKKSIPPRARSPPIRFWASPIAHTHEPREEERRRGEGKKKGEKEERCLS